MNLCLNKQIAITIFALLLLVQSSYQNSQQTNTSTTSQYTSHPQYVPIATQPSQSLYTENIQQFKSKKYSQRLQGLVGCWLLSKEYLDVYKSNYLFFKDLKLKQTVSLKLVKECMKRITRKDAILKITQLAGKNMQPPKRYEDIIPKAFVDSIFSEVSKLTIANYQQYKPINEDGINGEPQTKQGNQTALNNQQNFQALNSTQIQATQHILEGQQPTQQRITQQEKSFVQVQQASNIDRNSFTAMSDFDNFLIDLLKKYNQEFEKLVASKQGIKGRVEEQLKKRQKYYFGFIPASSFTHSVFLVTISLSMVFCCTCYKYYRIRSNEITQKKMKNSQQSQEGCKSHSHAHASKDVKKLAMAKMAQLTMKKKKK